MKRIILIILIILSFSLLVSAQNKEKTNDPIKFDEFGIVGECEEGANLDGFFLELVQIKEAKGFIIIRSNSKRNHKRALRRISIYLHYRGFARNNIYYIIDESGDNLKTELWIFPENSGEPDCKDCEVINAQEYDLKKFPKKEKSI